MTIKGPYTVIQGSYVSAKPAQAPTTYKLDRCSTRSVTQRLRVRICESALWVANSYVWLNTHIHIT